MAKKKKDIKAVNDPKTAAEILQDLLGEMAKKIADDLEQEIFKDIKPDLTTNTTNASSSDEFTMETLKEAKTMLEKRDIHFARSLWDMPIEVDYGMPDNMVKFVCGSRMYQRVVEEGFKMEMGVEEDDKFSDEKKVKRNALRLLRERIQVLEQSRSLLPPPGTDPLTDSCYVAMESDIKLLREVLGICEGG